MRSYDNIGDKMIEKNIFERGFRFQNILARFGMNCMYLCLLFISVASVSAQTTNFLTACKFISASNAIATGVSGTEVLSNDGGLSWNLQGTGLSDNLNGVSFYDNNNGILISAGAIGGSNIYKTTNGGTTWVYKASSTQTLQAIVAKNATFAIAVGNTGTVLKSTDGGTTWVSQVSGTANNLYDVHFVDLNNGTAVGEYGVIIHTNNGGSTWLMQASGTGFFLRGVQFVDLNTGMAVGDQGTILRTGNGGSSWSSQAASAAAGRILYSVYFTDANNGNIGGQGIVLHTANGGGAWSSQSLPATIAEISFTGSSLGIATGSSGFIYRTADGGVSWTQVAPSSNPPSAPSLSSPANNATGQSTSLTLSWNASGGASTYRLQVSTSSTFSTLLVDDSTLTSTSRLVNSLANNTTYYWRVNAKNTYGTSGWSSTWNFTTSSTLPGNFSLLSPSTGSIGQLLSGTLSWQSSTNATGYDVYLDGNNPPTTLVSSNQAGVSYNYSGLLNGLLYYWKVVARNSGGTTAATSSPWNFTTLLSAPPTPVPSSPASGATGQPTTLTLSWNPSSGATSYRLQVSTSSTFSSLVVDDATLTTTSRQVSGLLNNTLYYWRVSASNLGGTSVYSTAWSFTTVVASPGAFNLVSPSNAATSQSTSGTLSWQTSANATGYDVYLDGNNPPTTLVSPNQGGTSYAYLGLANSATYYWKVVAKNASGSTTATGAPWNFVTVVAAPVAPTLASPANGSTGQPTTLTLAWNAVSGATSYRLQVSTSSTFSTLALDDSTLTSPSRSVGSLANNTTYYWRVNGKNSSGTGGWSATWNFVTIPSLPVVVTTAASSVASSSATANGTVNPNGASTTAWFEWGTSSTLSTYSSTTSQLIGSGTAAVAVGASLTGLNPNTTYYFRIAAQNAGGTQRDGILSFTTAAILPTVTTTTPTSVATSSATVNGTANPNGATTTIWFEWGTSSTLTISSSTSSQSIGAGTSALAVSANLTGLSANTTYYYRLAGQNSAGTQRDGILSFTTGATLPTVVTTAASSVTANSGTANGTVNPNGTATTAWFEWGTSSTLATSTNTASQSAGSGTSAVSLNANLSGLSANTTYYYRIAAQNSAGTQKDGILSFTTGAILPAVTTTAATLVTSNSGTMNGTVNPNGAATSAWFEWGTSSTLTTSTSTTAQSAGSGTSSVSVSVGLTGLSVNTTYYYRVVGQNSAGTQKDGILSFTTGAILPAVTTTAATLVTTSSATLNGTVNPNGSATTTWFEWGTSSTLSTSSTTSTQSIGSGSSGVAISTSLSGLSSGTTYYFRAVGQNAAGIQRDGILSFTASALTPPATPTLASPANGSIKVSTSPTLSWSSSAGATSYRLQVSTSSTFSTLIFNDSTLTTTSRQIGALNYSTTYYWRVNAKNSGGTSGWSSVWGFATISVPPPPTAISPINGATNQATSLSLMWDTASGATSYRVQLSTDSTFGTMLVDDSLTTSSRPVSSLTNGTKYYWHVKSQNEAGASVYSVTNGFITTVTAPPAPVLASPLNGVTNLATTLTLIWNPSAGATTYRLQVSTSSTFSTLVFDDATITNTSSSVGGLAGGKLYYWHVTATNSGGTSSWSAVWNFKTKKGGRTHLTTASIDFGPVAVSSSEKDSFGVTNIGDTTVDVVTVTSMDPVFKVNQRDLTIQPGDTAQIYVVAAPETPTSTVAAVIVTYSDGLSPDTVMVRVDSVSGVTGVGDDKTNRPSTFALHQNYPNPFNPTTNISYDLVERSYVRLSIYNLAGQEVTTFVNEDVEAGSHEITWNATSNSGTPLPSGVYLYRLYATGLHSGKQLTQVHKMTLLK